jgi:hypothetical protein
MNAPERPQERPQERPEPKTTSTLIDWFSEGESKVVEIAGVRIVVRFVGRRGRKGRIAIEAPAGARFEASEHRTI